MDSFDNDIKRYKKEEERLVTKISASGFTRNLQEAIAEQNVLKNTVNDICNILEKNQYELNEYNEMLHKLQNQQNKLTSDELNLKSKMQDEKGIINKLKDLQNLEATLSLELDNARETIEPIQEKLEKYVNNFERTKKQHNKKIEDNRKEVLPLIIN